MNHIVDIPKAPGQAPDLAITELDWENAPAWGDGTRDPNGAADVDDGGTLLLPDDGRRPDPHVHRTRNLRGGLAPLVREEDPAPPTLGELGGGSPYIPDAPADPLPPATAHDWLSDAGRCELAAVYPLIARMQRECPGVCVRVAVSFAVSGLADGTGHTDVRPGWELAAWRGADVYSGRGHDLEQLAAFACARIGGARK